MLELVARAANVSIKERHSSNDSLTLAMTID
jgi:hypothetical protein